MCKSIRSSSLKCAKCQIFGTFGTPNTKNRILSNVPNLKNYTTLLQYRFKYETVRTTMTKLDIIILLHFYLSSFRDISLSLRHSLSLPFPPCSRSLSRKLSPISPPHFLVLVVDLASPRHWSCHLILHDSPLISPPHAPILVDLVGFGFVIGFWFGLRLWVVSQVTSMGWVEVVGCDFDGLIQVIWVEVVGCGWIMDCIWD